MKPREYYLNLLHTHVKNPKMIAHSLASEAVMRALARKFGEDENVWGLAGLLHDIDVEWTEADSFRHGPEGAAFLQEHDIPAEVTEAIRLHNERAAGGEKRSTRLHHALAAGETITGLIFAVALVYPDKKISSVKPKSVTKRMKEKLFAASVKRENISECEQIGIPLPEFAQLALEALAPIEEQLGF